MVKLPVYKDINMSKILQSIDVLATPRTTEVCTYFEVPRKNEIRCDCNDKGIISV